MGFPGCSDDKESACNAWVPGLIPGLGRSPGEGHGNLLQHSCLENSTDRGARWATVHRVTKRHNWSDLAHTRTKEEKKRCSEGWSNIEGRNRRPKGTLEEAIHDVGEKRGVWNVFKLSVCWVGCGGQHGRNNQLFQRFPRPNEMSLTSDWWKLAS